ncbi:MAG: hypothetical protein WAP03_22395 [Methylorubrum rhodinum]|uniref:hypothetical protein n=1 Tax=Methylorubrum rhodinum TaxID=29428 RepID=UPI003BAE8B9D
MEWLVRRELESETEALEMAVRWGDGIGLRKDGETLDVPMPAVPQDLIGLLMSGPVLLYDGNEVEFS